MKKILTMIIASMLALSMSLFAVGCSTASESSGNTSASESTSGSDSSTENDVTKVERASAEDTLNNNYLELTVNDAIAVKNNDFSIITKALKGVMVGDIFKAAISKQQGAEVFVVDYYSDGFWYMGSEKDKVKFQIPSNAIFKYEIGSGKPLDLTEKELKLYGSDPVITIFEAQFPGMSFDDMISTLPAEVKGLLVLCKSITVKDVYDITNNDFSSLKTIFKNVEVHDLIDALNVVLSDSVKDEKTKLAINKISVLLKASFSGTLGNLVASKDLTWDSVLTSYKDIVNIILVNQTVNCAFDELAKLLNGVTLEKTVNGVKNLNVHDVIDSIAIVVNTTTVEADKAKVDKLVNDGKVVLSGTLGKLVLTETPELNLTTYINDVLKFATKTDDQMVAAQFVAGYIKATAAYFAEIEEAVNALATLVGNAVQPDNQSEIDKNVKVINDATAKYLKALVSADGNPLTAEMEAFINELSDAIASSAAKMNDKMNAFIASHKDETLGEMDTTYLNGYLAKLAKMAHFNMAEIIAPVKLGDMVAYVKNPVANVRGIFDVLKNHMIANGTIKGAGGVVTQQGLTFEQYDAKYFGGIVKMMIPAEQFPMIGGQDIALVANTMENVLSGKLLSMIGAIENGKYITLCSETGTMELLNYSVFDYIEVLGGADKPEMAEKLGTMKIANLVNLAVRINAMNQKPAPQQ